MILDRSLGQIATLTRIDEKFKERDNESLYINGIEQLYIYEIMIFGY